jgi:hypothetical protein
MASILSWARGRPNVYDNHQVSSALEDYFSGSASKGDKKMIGELLEKSELTVPDLRARGFKDASKHLKMVDELIHRQYQTMRHLQKSIDAMDFKSRIIKRMDLELADFENKAQAIDVKPS